MPEDQGTGNALPLLGRGPIRYDSAIEKDGDMLKKLGHVAENKAFYHKLWSERQAIETITRCHLGCTTTKYHCTVASTDEWLRGGFNVCIPVSLNSIDGQDQRHLLFRCPLPYKLAESHYPGTIDEKVGGEVGAYVWMQEHCPDVRIPHLYGFGFSDGRQFSHAVHCPWYARAVRGLRRIWCGLLKQDIPSHYVLTTAPVRLPSAYLLLERVDSRTGMMLASTWDSKRRGDPTRRQRLFRGLARTILSLARVPQSKIGSFRFYNDGTVALVNRPLTSTIVLLENSGAPRTIQQDDTYQCTEAFVSDMLTFHDDNFRSNPNAAYSLNECQAELAVKATLRTLSHNYVRRQSRTGPFPLQFTDLHIGNIFVDEEWNVTCLIDLEWVCAMPAEMLTVPYWLTGRGIDMLDGENLAQFNSFREEFMHVFEEEEQKMPGAHSLPLARIMQETWESGGAWFWLSLDSVNAAYSLVYSHILPRFTRKLVKFRETIYQFWCQESDKLVQAKLADYKAYDEELRKAFGMPNGPPQT